jgi:3-oxoacyl-[acyl-carrier protein] reductase
VSDFLLRLGSHAAARRLVRRLGLPVQLPQALARASGPWEARPLAGQAVAAAVADAGPVAAAIARALVLGGADPHVAGAGIAAFRDLGEAYAHPAAPLHPASPAERVRFQGLVLDATAVETAADLRVLHDFFHPLVSRLASCGRAVVIGRPPAAAASASAAAARAALDGFVRSLAREIGRRGATAQLLVVDAGAEPRLAPVLRFLLSPRSAFMTGQPIAVTARVPAEGEDDVPVRPLERKVALVTGAARGIGEATARLMAGEGAHVVCLDRPQDGGPASQVARAVGGSVLLADLTDAGTPALVARHLDERHGGVDVVVHNAGITRDKTLGRMTVETWTEVIDVNLAAMVRLDEALGGGVLRDRGRVICLSSVSGIAGNVGQTNYAASKAGVIGYVRWRADQLAARGITVNAVAPGFIETRLTAAMPLMIREAARRLSALGQGGLPRDVAEVVTFLASPGAAGITGAVLRVCGGAFVGA